MPKKILALFLMLLMHGAANAHETIKLIGHYTNMIVEGAEDPHFISGYNLDLYQKNSVVFGNLSIAIGSGEPVTVELKEVSYKMATKKLQFMAEYSPGREINQQTGMSGREQRTVLTFNGTINPKSIVGKIGIKDKYCDKCKPHLYSVSLKRTPDTFNPYDE